MAFPTTQDGGPARGCHGRHGWMPRGHSTTSSSGEHGQMVAAREDREGFLKWGTLVLKQLPAIPAGRTRNTGRSILRLLVLECALPSCVSSASGLRTPSIP